LRAKFKLRKVLDDPDKKIENSSCYC